MSYNRKFLFRFFFQTNTVVFTILSPAKRAKFGFAGTMFAEVILLGYVIYISDSRCWQHGSAGKRMTLMIKLTWLILILARWNLTHLIRNKIVITQEPIPIEKSHNSQQDNYWGPGTTRPRASGSFIPNSCKVGNYVMSQQVWVFGFIPWSTAMRATGCWEIVQFPTAPFSTDVNTGHGINTMTQWSCLDT